MKVEDRGERERKKSEMCVGAMEKTKEIKNCSILCQNKTRGDIPAQDISQKIALRRRILAYNESIWPLRHFGDLAQDILLVFDAI